MTEMAKTNFTFLCITESRRDFARREPDANHQRSLDVKQYTLFLSSLELSVEIDRTLINLTLTLVPLRVSTFSNIQID